MFCGNVRGSRGVGEQRRKQVNPSPPPLCTEFPSNPESPRRFGSSLVKPPKKPKSEVGISISLGEL
jgi:hypothetical protein